MRTPSLSPSSLSSSLTSVAKNLLADRAFDIEFHGYLSNHAKHAIVALDRLEAPASRVQEYWDEYTALTPYSLSLHKVEQDWNKVQPADLRQWTEWRGKKIGWQEQVAFMDQELNGRFKGNTQKLVQEYAPDLLSGFAGALTHGIIHLGWALDADSPWMLCEGLAYLNFCHLGVDETKFRLDQHDDDTSLLDSLIRVGQTFETEHLKDKWVDQTKASYDETFHPELVAAGFQWQLSKILDNAHSVMTDLPSWLSNEETSLDDIWESLYRDTVLLYLSTRSEQGDGNFVVLHLITSLWALEQTTKTIDNPAVTRHALRQHYASLIGLLATAGFPSPDKLQAARDEYNPEKVDPSDYDWTNIVKRGIAEQEEHNIKLVYVARELWKRYGHWSGFSEAAQSFTITPSIGPSSTSFTATTD